MISSLRNYKILNLFGSIFLTSFFLLSTVACGQDLTRNKAEKIIKQNYLFGIQTQTIKVVEGSWIPVGKSPLFRHLSDGEGLLVKRHKDIDDVYRYLKDQGYIEFSQVIRRGLWTSGIRFGNDYYQIFITDKMKKKIVKTSSEVMETNSYKVDGRKIINKLSYLIHEFPVEVSNIKFVRIESIRDMKDQKSLFSDCDAIVRYVYEVQLTDIGKGIKENGKHSRFGFLDDTREGTLSKEVCFQLFDNGWKIMK